MVIFSKYGRLIQLLDYTCGYCVVTNNEAIIQPPLVPTKALVNYGVSRNMLDKHVIPTLAKAGMLKPIYNYYVDTCLSKQRTFESFDEQNIPHPKLIPLEDIGEYASVLIRVDGLSRQQGLYYSQYPHTKVEELKERYDQQKLFAVEWLELYAEYRVLVWKESVIDIFPHIRIPTDAEAVLRLYQDIFWDYAIRALQAVQLDIGAVDIGVCQDGQIVVFEVNSRFGVGDTERGRMVAALIKELIRGE